MKKFNEPVIDVVEFALSDLSTGLSDNFQTEGIDPLPPVVDNN